MKKTIAVLLMVFGFILVSFYLNKEKPVSNDNHDARVERISEVIESAWDEFGLFSLSFGSDEDPTIWIGMDETKSETELQKFIEENTYQTDLKHYNIEVFKKNIQELEKEHMMSRIEHMIFEYINGENYRDVQVQVSSIEPQPLLYVTINESSNLSGEKLKTELENLLSSLHSELAEKNISYDLEIVKEKGV